MKKFTVTIEGLNWKDIQELELLDLPKEGDTVETRYGTCIVTEAELQPDSGERAARSSAASPDAPPSTGSEMIGAPISPGGRL